MEPTTTDNASPAPAELKAKREALLRETIAFYGADLSRRAVQPSGSCAYRIFRDDEHTVERNCAVGRLLTEAEKDAIADAGKQTEVVARLAASGLLPQRLVDLDPNFLGHIQLLHDLPENWDVRAPAGLSEEGRKAVACAAAAYGLDMDACLPVEVA